MAATILLCLATALAAGCSPEPEAEDVNRSDLVGRWHADGSCDSSLVLEKSGSARWKHWATGYNVSESRITGRQDGQGSWTLETVDGKRYFEVETDKARESLTMVQGDDRLILLQIPGDDPDNSVGCRFKQVGDRKHD
ncbi:hypothetical protein ACIRO1_13300 [Streptomyces sp. NPDC102381]|uniref:hypothetical protein n=1 Tax=Streptomyces sp. NPDC102381 TaxID=3366164 RepID=UPI0037F5E34A